VSRVHDNFSETSVFPSVSNREGNNSRLTAITASLPLREDLQTFPLSYFLYLFKKEIRCLIFFNPVNAIRFRSFLNAGLDVVLME